MYKKPAQCAKSLGFLIQRAYQRTVPVPLQERRTVPTYRTRTITKKTHRTSVPYFLAKIEVYCTVPTYCIAILVHKYTWYRPSMDQKPLIDFCIVSSDLFSDVLDFRVKRGAELSTDHHLVICSLRLSKRWPNKRSNRSSVTYRIKWEALEDKEVRKQFASSISSMFRQLPNVSEDIQKEWLVFRSAIISSATESCGRKRLRVAGDSEKRTPWWNHEVKEAIRAKKDTFKAWL